MSISIGSPMRWISGFANAQGGSLFIGMGDTGKVTGVKDVERLLQEIPNKVRDFLGIIVDVDMHTKAGKKFLEIKVEPYPFPVSYKGQYHYRSGSTKQELKGTALDRFLLGKQGKHWDSVPVPNVGIRELDEQAFSYFRKNAARSKRLSSEVLQENNKTLIEELHLSEGQYLKRAAILLFHSEPEKFVTGSYVKIGYFKTDDDLIFQDEIHGNLFNQVEKTMDLLLTKYLKANISYEGVNRIETYPLPEPALRETLLNALAHKDYASGNPVQISVYDDKLIFWNEGQLPENWTVERLKQKHPSKPFNPDIATTLFRAGLIEAWGRGIEKINTECKKAGVPTPEIDYDFGGLMFTYKIIVLPKTREKTREKILKIIVGNPSISTKEMAEIIGITQKGIEWQMALLKKDGAIERVGSAKGGYWKILS